MRCASIEEGRRGVCEESARHQVVCLNRCINIVCVDPTADTQQHVLRALHDLAMDSQEVRLLQRLETEVVVLEIPAVLDARVQPLCVLAHEIPYSLRNQRCWPILLVPVFEQDSTGLRERRHSVLVQVRHRNARSKCGEVMVLLRHVGARLCRQGVNLRRGDSVVEPLDHLLRNHHGVHKLSVQAITKGADPGGYVVELHFLASTVPLEDIHLLSHRDYETASWGLFLVRDVRLCALTEN